MPTVPGSSSQSRAQQQLRPPEDDPQWSGEAAQTAPLILPPKKVWLCPMLSFDFDPGCHFKDYGTSDCLNASGGSYPSHNGIDFINSSGKDVYPMTDGVVVAVQTVDDGELGTWVWVRHIDKTHTRIVDSVYAHVTPAVAAEDVVTENTVIGTVADPTTGSSEAPHLHFEVLVAECANPSNGWEEAELSGYDTNIYMWRAGKWQDPLEFTPCGFCCTEDLPFRAASLLWVPFGQHPTLGLSAITQANCDDDWPYTEVATLAEGVDVYPFFDSPTGIIRVAKVQQSGPSAVGHVVLEHGFYRGRVHYSYYWAPSGNLVPSVELGQAITTGTKIATITHESSLPFSVEAWQVPPGMATTPEEAAEYVVCPRTYYQGM